MSRFVYIGNEHEHTMINVDHIVSVSVIENNQMEIRMADGTVFHTIEDRWDEVAGHEYITALYNCEGIAALVDIDGDMIPFPVSLLALTASGRFRPLNEDCEFMDDLEGTTFIGYESYDCDAEGDAEE